MDEITSQSQNQTWQVQKKTCQVKIKFDRCLDLPGFVLTWQVWFFLVPTLQSCRVGKVLFLPTFLIKKMPLHQKDVAHPTWLSQF